MTRSLGRITVVCASFAILCAGASARALAAAPVVSPDTTTHTTWRGYAWTTASASGAQVTQSRTALRFVMPASPVSDSVYATYTTRCKLSGSFTARIHYRLVSWPSNNGVRVGLLVDNPNYPADSDGVTTERTSFGASDVGVGENYVQNGIDTGGGLIEQTTGATAGVLRVVVRRGIIRSQYADATTSWKPLLIRDPAGDAARAPAYHGHVGLGLQVWSAPPVFAGPARVTLTRFRITRGHCV